MFKKADMYFFGLEVTFNLSFVVSFLQYVPRYQIEREFLEILKSEDHGLDREVLSQME